MTPPNNNFHSNCILKDRSHLSISHI